MACDQTPTAKSERARLGLEIIHDRVGEGRQQLRAAMPFRHRKTRLPRNEGRSARATSSEAGATVQPTALSFPLQRQAPVVSLRPGQVGRRRIHTTSGFLVLDCHRLGQRLFDLELPECEIESASRATATRRMDFLTEESCSMVERAQRWRDRVRSGR